MALTDVKSEQIQSSVALAGSPTTTTQSASDNSTKIATTAYVETAVANLVASAPAALNTLDELAAALNDDASFSTTVTNSIATKLPLAGGTLTGTLNISTGASTRSASFVGNGIEVKHPTGASDLFIGSQTGNDVKLSVAGANALRLYTNSAERLNISGTGNATFTGTGTFAGGSTNNNDDANILTLTASEHARLLVDTSSTSGHRATLALESNGNELHLGTTGSYSYLTSVGALGIDGGKVDINKATSFSAYPTGSQLNVYGDGEGIRLDGSGATSRNIRFRNVSSANPGIIIADGGLKLETEDASTDIKLHAIRNIEYKVTSTNSTAGEHRFYSYNTEFVRFKGSNNQVKVGTLAVSSATSAPLHVAQANTDVQAVFGDNNYTIDDPSIRIIGRNSANSHIRYTFAGLDADADHGFIGYNAGSGGFVNALSFDTSGKVGIGTDSPAEKLEVAGTIKITNVTGSSSRLLLPNFWIGPVPSTANNNSGAVLLVNLDYVNPNNIGFQYSGAIIGNSYTGQAYINVNIVKHYSNDNIDFDVSGDSYLAGTVTRMQLKLCTVSYNSNSYLAIVKHGGGTGTIQLNGYFQGWDPSVVTEITSGNYSITTTHGSLNY